MKLASETASLGRLLETESSGVTMSNRGPSTVQQVAGMQSHCLQARVGSGDAEGSSLAMQNAKMQPASRETRGRVLIYQAAVGYLYHLSPDDYSYDLHRSERGCLDGFTTRITPSTCLSIFP